ncbi:unnamed protein product [Microthlaspi erraticum]|uniref:Uncharacterized protein n=1 Tax=Microthlaspi erraticum TaxID=1685480 RepID=A0A6D2ICV1_9BRAS|nr:unnamed protein product [Microthlaspi erraticum]
MADSSAPLLTYIEDEEDTSPPLNFDKIFEQSLTDFGVSQFLQIIIVGLALTFDSHQIFITVFTDAYPTWHCLDHTICNTATTDVCEILRFHGQHGTGTAEPRLNPSFRSSISSARAPSSEVFPHQLSMLALSLEGFSWR